jgi:Gp157 protein
MQPLAVVRNELTNYLILTAHLKEQYADIDDETLADTLEGISGLPEAIEAVVRSSLDDGALIEGLKGRLAELELRLERFKDRHEKKRALARWAMLQAGLEKLMASDFSVGLRKGLEKLEVVDEASIPQTYFVPQPPKLDRKTLTEALKRGTIVSGADLVTGETSLQVRVR